MLKLLKKLKKSFYYEMFIEHIFYNLYNFLWKNVLNFKARFLYLFLKSKDNYFSLDKNDKILIKNNQEFKNLAHQIKEEATSKIPKLTETIMSDRYKLKIESQNKAFGEVPYSIDFYEDLSNDLKSKIVNFASSEKMINTAANYMGIFPMITRIQVSLNIPRENSKARSAMLWHKDAFGFKNLDFFMAVTDIDEESGPFYCLKKKINAGVFKNFQYQNNKSGERGKVDLDSFNKVFSDPETISLIGKSGTAFFLDSFSTFHRGGYCKSKDRLVLRICYQSHDVLHNSYQRNNNFFLFDKSIRKKEIKDEYKKYLFFKSPSKIMRFFSKLSMKFFSLVEFKY